MSSILKVSEIQDPTNGNSALTIDSSGRVLQPAKPAFFVYKNTGNYQWGGGVAQFDTIEIDTDNGWDNTNYRYVFPVSGVWWINVIWHNTTNQQTSGFLRKNGSNYMFAYQANDGGGREGTMNISVLMQVNAGDNTDFHGWSASSAGVGIVSGMKSSAFQGYLLG